MTDPISLSAAGIATLFLIEAIKKSGAVTGEHLLKQLEHLSQLLQERFKPLFTRLQKLPPGEESNILDAEIVTEVEAAAQSDAEVQETITAIAQTVREQKLLTDSKFGNLKVGNITLKAPKGGFNSQQVAVNLDVEGDAVFGDMNMES